MDGIKGVLNKERVSHISAFQITILLPRRIDIPQRRAHVVAGYLSCEVTEKLSERHLYETHLELTLRTLIIITTPTTSSDNERDKPLKLLKK